ncbi:MAG TPA: hypothetical protein VHF06_25420 [Pseudonocardiaceae bacterium]|jgi:hypothetical protein|nr:hypothetical protein [Pseudonocardiaceae bacterium]
MWKTTALGASVVVTAALLAAGPAASSAHAAGSCWDAGFVKAGYEAYYCHNVGGIPVYNSEFTAVVGYLNSTTSWFACRIDYGPANGEGSPHPNRWLWTLGDTSDEAWGYVSDKDIYDETNPVHAC